MNSPFSKKTDHKTGAKQPKRELPWSRILLLAPASIYLFIFLVLPLFVTLFHSLQPSPIVFSTKPWANYVYFFKTNYLIRVLIRTIRFASISTIISLVLGYLVAIILRQRAEGIGSTAILILSYPILSGPIVTVMGWMSMLTSGGVVGKNLTLLFRFLGIQTEPINLLRTDTAVIMGLVHFSLPFVILNIFNVMVKIDQRLEEAAMNLGAKKWQTFWHIIWPLSLPGVFAASLIAFALSMNTYVTPTFLGNASRLVMTTQIVQFMRTSFNVEMSSTTTVILLWVSLLIIVLYTSLFTRRIKPGE